MRRLLSRCTGVALVLAGCADGGAPSAGEAAPAVTIAVAALSLAGVGDVVWDVEVKNGADAVVWQRRVSSSAYGDSAGSASLVGPCDADPAASLNAVRVWVVGVYTDDVTGAAASAFAAGDASAVAGTALPFQNPTAPATPLTRSFTCAPNADVAVAFDVTLGRPAQQGFFDVAVSFNDLFCAAKFDCCYDATGDGCGADETIALLFDPSGQRARTFVLGLACTAGAATEVQTDLYLDPLTLDCTSPNSGTDFVANLRLDPAGATAGNLCPAGALTGCPAVTELGVDADIYLFQIAVFRGEEALTSGGVDAQKVYWNVALGVKDAIAGCRLRTRATADDRADPDDLVVNGVVAAGAVYPYVQWDLALDASCGSEALRFGVPDAPVTAAYTGTGDGATTFAYHFAPGLPAGSFCSPVCQHGGACVGGVCQCAAGYSGPSCETNINDCAPTNPCLNGGTCTDGVASFSCACAAGYTGATCATNINDCAPTNPCANGGTCTDGVASFSCACANGYEGAICETNINDCAPTNPCANGGTCTDGVASFSCACANGYTGPTCATATGCVAGSQAFTYTGANQSFTMPAGCTTLTAKLWGAGGGAGQPHPTWGNTFTAGGAGGYSTGVLAVAPGTVLTVVVGQSGTRVTSANTGATYGGGGGTQASVGGGQGGGRSALRLACGDLITAGGGGGGSNSQTYATLPGGAGGGATGGTPDGGLQSGGGATASAGGAAGAYNGPTAGSAYQGGLGSATGHGTSGGGGGRYGGGGANIGAGGGGSGYVGGCGGIVPTAATTTAGSGTTPPGTGDSAYAPGTGVGGNLTGGAGRVVVSWSL